MTSRKCYLGAGIPVPAVGLARANGLLPQFSVYTSTNSVTGLGKQGREEGGKERTNVRKGNRYNSRDVVHVHNTLWSTTFGTIRTLERREEQQQQTTWSYLDLRPRWKPPCSGSVSKFVRGFSNQPYS